MTADFLNNPTVAKPAKTIRDLNGPDRYFNRELSWLEFDRRVLDEAENPNVPLLERVRFLAISGSNLDEFFSVRVAALYGVIRHDADIGSVDGMTAADQVAGIATATNELQLRQQKVWRQLCVEMAEAGIQILGVDDISKAERERLSDRFMAEVFPVLTPIAVDPAHPFPFIPNGEFALAMELARVSDGRPLTALLPIPHQLDRFLRLEDGRKGEARFLPLEALLEFFVPMIFPGYEIENVTSFRLLRDSDLEVEEEAEDLVREFETALRRRRRGVVIRLEFSANAPETLRTRILDEIGVAGSEVVDVDGLIGFSDVKELVIHRPDLLYRPYRPRVPERVQDFDGDILAAISHKDMLLHHPYETFNIVVRFVEQAAEDPDVVAIKQTLYRTSRNSPIVSALCKASEAGKSVTALVELKARFDEAANIQQSRQLERAGVQVVYGFIDWKTHAKISTVVRREGAKLVTYTHLGTGNYHPITANIYTDLSLFTCDPAIGRDATKVFNYVSGYARPDRLENLSIAPLGLKERIIECIEAEAQNARAGKPAAVWLKVNALVEPDVIDALYAASQAGVAIDLIVRSICGLKPGVPGMSDNIRVKSIVGRFLEHSRIYCFGNGQDLPSKGARVFMSSADLMGRNLKRRVETLVEIENPTVHSQIIDQIMAANLADEAQSWVLRSDGTYERTIAQGQFNCHRFFMENPSMSGRGRAGTDDAPRLTHSKD